MRDQADQTEEAVDHERGDDHRHEHQRGDPQRELPAVVLAIDQDDWQHDQIGEQEGHHAAEADPARPQHRGERHVADRADEREHRDHGSGDDVLDRADSRRGVLQKQRVEEAVAELRDEAGEEEADGDLLPEHSPVVAEVVGDVGPRFRRAQSLANAHLPAGRLVLVAGLRRLRVLACLFLEPA